MYYENFRRVITDTMENEGLGEDHKMINSEVEEKNKFLQEDIESCSKKHFFLVARYEDKIVGTIAYGPCGELIIECSEGKYNNKLTIAIFTIFMI